MPEGRLVSDTSRYSKLALFAPLIAEDWPSLAGDANHVTLDGTLVSADVSGFTRMADELGRAGRAGSETVIRAMDGVFVGLIQPVLELDGDVLHFAGDELMVLFRGPDHAVRAAFAALAMQREMRNMSTVKVGRRTKRLEIAVGVASGAIVVARLGSAQHCFVVLGKCVTETCQLEKAAVAGEIVISQSSLDLLPHAETTASASGGDALTGLKLPQVSPVIPTRRRTNGDSWMTVPGALREPLAEDRFEGEHRPLAVAFLGVRSLDQAQIGRAHV